MATPITPIATAKPVVEKSVVEETTVAKDVDVKKTSIVEKRKFKAEDGIPCVSITTGELIVTGPKTGIAYDWLGRGDTVEVEYQDLVACIRMNKACIKKPHFIVEDEDFLAEYPQVKEIYGTMYSYGDLRKVLTDLDVMSMKLTIESLPEGARDSIRNIASSMIQRGQLDSVNKIKMLDEIYDTNFMLLSGLYEN